MTPEAMTPEAMTRARGLHDRTSLAEFLREAMILE